MAVASKGSRTRGSRRLSREFALRALYQWRLTGADLASLIVTAEDSETFRQANSDYFQVLLSGVLGEMGTLNEALTPHVDRPVAELSPIEHAALLVGAYELAHCLDVPYRVAINEAVELAKRYGGTDGHKYVNGVLDKLARHARHIEIEAARHARPEPSIPEGEG
jgi:N utilization substance protein B